MNANADLAAIRAAIEDARAAAEGDSNDAEISAWQYVGDLFDSIDQRLTAGGVVANSESVNVKVTIYSDNETTIDAPEGVTVTIDYAVAEQDTHCKCGSVIRRVEEDMGHRNPEGGEWFHVDAPYYWGDDHTAEPESA